MIYFISKIMMLFLGCAIFYHIFQNKVDLEKDNFDRDYIRRKNKKINFQETNTKRLLLNAPKEKEYHEEYKEAGYNLTEYLERKELINDWLKQLRSEGYIVEKWEFLEDLSHILVKFKGEQSTRYKLFIENDIINCAKSKNNTLNGYIIPEFSEEKIEYASA